MCGIAGILNFDDGRPVDPHILARMRDAMVHRGPDDEGLFIDGPIGLAARRLSIIDLVTGSQPVHNEDRSVWAVLNGEIYNFRALREELQCRGHRFHTSGDTETLVHAYEQYGPECVQHLKGMFAIAVWDGNARTLFLARDRMGEKPLHYFAGPHELIFASELKALMRHPSMPRDLDPASLTKYLTFQFVPAPHTVFSRVRKLEPGHSLLISAGRPLEVTPRQYWDIPLEERNTRKKIETYSEELLALLRQSIRSQLVSDVPVGVLLSGGMDSTLVAALAAEAQPGLQTFTMSFEEPSYDESKAARLVADRIGSEHHVEVCRSDDMKDVIPAVTAFMDEPLGDASILPTFLLSKFAVKSVKVALGGDGGDELFAGYPTFQALELRKRFRALPAAARAAAAAGVNALPVSHEYLSLDFKLRQFLRGTDHTAETDFFYWMGAFTEEEKKPLLARWLGDGTFDDVSLLAAARKSQSDVQRCLYLCAKLYLQDGVLVKVDRASMANSLEVRAPYLDHQLVEFAARCPLEYKMTMWRTKLVLRRAAENLLPSSIVRQQKKRGFGVPISGWISGGLRDMFQEYLDPGRLEREGLFNPGYVQRLLSDHAARRKNNWKLLWTLLVFQLWKEQWHTSGP